VSPPLAAAGLFVATFVLYVLTYSSTPVSDTYSWIRTIETADFYMMVLAGHALPLYVDYTLKRLLAWVGTPVATLSIIQTLNAGLAALGAVMFYRLVRVLSGDNLLALLGGALLATSFGYWYFANGELHHWGLVFPLAIFVLIVGHRRRGGGAPALTAGLGALNAVGIMFHQDAVLFGFSAVVMLLVDRPRREGVADAAAYIAGGSVATMALAVLVGIFVRGLDTARDLLEWYFWPTWASGVMVYEIGGLTGSVLRSIKAQATALAYGSQVFLDLAREPAVRADGLSWWFAALTLLAYGVMVALLVGLWRARGLVRTRYLVPFTGCVVWLVAYKLFLNSWFQPASTEYHMVSLPPLILLLLLWPIAAGPPAAPPRTRALLRGAVAVLLGALFVVNFWGAILPWRGYGQMKDALAARFQPEFRAGELFVSNESGIDTIFIGYRGHVGIKDTLKEKGRAEGFRSLEALIAEHLGRGGRLFLYNVTPNPFTLRKINMVEPSGGRDPVAYGDFDRFVAALRERYAFVPVVSYWEEAKIPLVLFGRRFETIWELKPGRAS
jgi:hypothetical protein